MLTGLLTYALLKCEINSLEVTEAINNAENNKTGKVHKSTM
jgi:hypothetical protein